MYLAHVAIMANFADKIHSVKTSEKNLIYLYLIKPELNKTV